MTVVDTDMVQKNAELNLEISSCIKSMPSKKKSSFQCEFCGQACSSSGGLKRHKVKKHPVSSAQKRWFQIFLNQICSPKQKVNCNHLF